MLNNTDWRLMQLEKSSTVVGEKVDKIMTNHLPHLHDEVQEVNSNLNTRIQELRTRVNMGIGINVFMFIATLLGILMILKH